MRIDYNINNNQVKIIRVYGTASYIVLPDTIDGYPVTSVAPYCFSARKRSEDTDVLSTVIRNDSLDTDEDIIAGEIIESVTFPDTVTSIGNYIFYGCKNLKEIKFSDRLKDIGSGAFTGCGAVRHLEVRLCDGNKTCVKEILGDLWQRIDVTLINVKTNEISELVFPEHYEEAVENTPARILYTQHHGSGNDYRQCFYNKELDYFKYDSLFVIAMARDDIHQLEDQVFKRLKTPVSLVDKHKEDYINFIKDNYKVIIEDLIEKDRTDLIELLGAYNIWNSEMLDLASDIASSYGRTEILSMVMNKRVKTAPVKKKRFVL